MPKVGRRSENLLYDGGSNGDKVSRNAPFGTTHTPVVRTKIVGGKPRYVLDRESVTEDPRHVAQHHGNNQPELLLKPHSDTKKNIQKDFEIPDGTGDPRQQPKNIASTHTAPPALYKDEASGAVQRPLWNSRPVLPPINGSHFYANQKDWHSLNDLSTHGNLGRDESDTDRHRRANSDFDHSGLLSSSEGAGHGISGTLQDQVKYDIDRVGSNDHPSSFLPQAHNAHEPDLLLHRLRQQLDPFRDGRSLKGVYVDLASYDHDLTGWVDYRHLALTLMRAKIFIKDEDLREAATRFISLDHPGKVNYEQLLSYLASVMRHRHQYQDASPRVTDMAGAVTQLSPRNLPFETPAHRQQGQQQQHFPSGGAAQSALGHSVKHSHMHPSHTGSQGKLMHMIEEQLMSLDDGLDLEKLRQEFVMADRLQRQTLSHKQIKDIVYRMRIPLQESVINQILDRCQTHGDGQYWWQDFVSFLERVQPVHTGLDIKPSKKPVDYAKHYPAPDSSWPHVPTTTTTGHDDKHIVYTQPDSVRLDRPADAGESRRGASQDAHHRDGRRPFEQGTPNLPPLAAYGPAPKHHRHDTTVDDDWFDRFAYMAEALYRNDQKGEGTLPVDEAKWLIAKYNDVYQLRLSELAVSDSVQRWSRGDNVAIDPLLKSLATVVK